MTDRVVVMGIDGGATSTACVIVDGEGRVLGKGRGGPVDHLYRASGRRKTTESLRQAIRSATRAARLTKPVRSVVAGLTGLEPASPQSADAVRILRSLTRARIIKATWDAEVAFVGASAGGPGVLVIAGTGSVALARNARGEKTRAGGYGFLIDDAGGGVSIGQAGLRAALRSGAGQGPRTRLGPMIRSRLGPWPWVRARVYGEGGGRTLLASLAPLVDRAAKQGDPVARRILSDAGEALGQLAVAVARQLGMLRERFPVFLVGGVFEAGRAVVRPLRRTVRSAAPRCVIRRPQLSPELGAAMMALQAAGSPVTSDIIRRLSRSQD